MEWNHSVPDHIALLPSAAVQAERLRWNVVLAALTCRRDTLPAADVSDLLGPLSLAVGAAVPPAGHAVPAAPPSVRRSGRRSAVLGLGASSLPRRHVARRRGAVRVRRTSTDDRRRPRSPGLRRGRLPGLGPAPPPRGRRWPGRRTVGARMRPGSSRPRFGDSSGGAVGDDSGGARA